MYAGTSGTGDGGPWGMAGMEATFPLAFQGISHFSLLKHMVFFLITAATPHWERGKEACIGPGFVGERRGRGKKKGGVGVSSRLRGLLSTAALSLAWHVCVPVPSGFGPLFVEAKRETGVLYLLPESGFSVRAQRTSSLFYGGNQGRGCQVD